MNVIQRSFPGLWISDEWLLLGCCLLLACGCSHAGLDLAPVAGSVTLDGKVVAGAVVAFLSDDVGRPATGKTDAEGKYRLETYALGEGATLGDHRVTVTLYDTPALVAGQSIQPNKFHWIVPERYSSPTTSGLTAMVTHGSNVLDFNLSSKTPAAP